MGNACGGGEGKPAAIEQVKAETPEEVADSPVVDKAPEEEAAPAPPSPRAPKLTLKIMGARGLRKADWLPGMGTSDCFCKLKIAGKEEFVFQTKTINDTLTPLWQEETDIYDFSEGDDLEFSVWDEDMGKAPDALGKVVLENADFASGGFNRELELRDEAGKGIKAFLRLKVKMAGQDDYPAGPPPEFSIEFDKDPKVKTLGLLSDETDGKYIYVNAVSKGPFQTYNEQAKPDKQLKPGDFLVKINDKEGDAKKMMEELKSARNLNILARRPEEICIAINRKDVKLPCGVEFPKKPTGNALLITKVNDGPFKDWNDANAHHQVCNNDRVVSVAGCQGKAVDLQKRMMKTAAFQAIIVRPAETEKSWWW